MPWSHSSACRRTLYLWLVLCAAGAVLPAVAQTASAPALVIFSTSDEAAMRAAVADITREGGVLRHSMPPHAAIVELPQEAEAALAEDPRIDLIARGAVDPNSIPAEYGRAARDAAVAWNQQYVYPKPAAIGPPVGARPLSGDVRLAPRPVQAPGAAGVTAAPGPPGADQWQTTEYMMGSTTISLIFLESDGSGDANTEDWTETETSQVVSECVGALNWWVSRYPYSVAPLSFTWDYHYAVPTGYEPITRSSDQDVRWIADALTELGYPCTAGTTWNAVSGYLNDIRDAHETDWAYAVFVVDSSNDADGSFSDGYFAYAYLNGPYVVMTYDNDGWGIASMDSVLSHETGHIFGAGDEYCDPGYACCDPDEYDGYLHIQNTNCVEFFTDPTDQSPCLMNDNSSAVCAVTQKQLGWRDTPPADGVPDILDVAPTATLDSYSPDPSGDATPTFTGSATVGFFPNQSTVYPGPDVTLNRIAGVQYRIDGGEWQNCAAVDGDFDGGAEEYTFTTAPLPDGTYTFEVRAVDTSGNTSEEPYASDELTVAGHMVEVSVLADPMVVSTGDIVQLTGEATDMKGHAIASYSWDDGGAGGVFLPTATTSGPAYTAPENATGGDISVTLTMTATCAGDPPVTDSGSVTITVHFDAGGDADSDGMPNGWELDHGMDPMDASDASVDADSDGLTALQEYEAGSDPDNRDTDGDGFGDAEEATLGSDPADPSSVPDHGHFSDVEPTGFGPELSDPFWAFHEIEACYRSGIVSGYADGTYQPGVTVSRDQMAVYVARALAGGDANVPKDYTVASFTDVPTDHWAFDYIEYAVEQGIVRGYDTGDYKPLLAVDRGTMAVYIARSIVSPIGDDSSLPRPMVPTFTDVPTEYWSYAHVEYCVAQGVVHGYDDGLYHPELAVTRDQMAVYIARAFDLPM